MAFNKYIQKADIAVGFKITHKPDSVTYLGCYHLSRINITAYLNLPTPQVQASNFQNLIYMTFHHIEFT